MTEQELLQRAIENSPNRRKIWNVERGRKMKLLIEIDDSISAQYQMSECMDVRLHKVGERINKVTVATNENPYFNLLPFQIISDDCEILTKEAYEDLCMNYHNLTEVVSETRNV